MISLVIPLYNEEQNIEVLYNRICSASETWDYPFEVILIDDGSRDATLSMIKDLNAKDPRFKFLSFSRNFGHQTAVTAGLEHVNGQVICIIDADLQDPPEILNKFINKWKEGYDVVYAIRTKRKESAIKKSCYWAFYRILGALSSIHIPLDSGDFCVMDRKVVDTLNGLPERNRFVRGLRSWVGFKHIGVEYERDARLAGETKYSLRKLFKLAFDGLIGFSYRPLQLIGMIGFSISMCAFFGLCLFLVFSAFDIPILGHSPREAPGYTTLTLAVLLLGGIQLISLGIIGEYIGRIFDEVKARPLYILKEQSGFETIQTLKKGNSQLNA